MEISQRAWRAQFDLSESEGRIISGIAVPYGQRSDLVFEQGMLFTEDIVPGAFKDSISKRGDRIKILAAHNDRGFPLGRPTGFDERADGLFMTARISNTAAGNDALALIKDGVLDGFSVGYGWSDRDVTWSNNMSHRTVNKGVLNEVSLVNFPAFDDARVASVRSASSNAPMKRSHRYQGTFSEISDAVGDAIETLLGVDDVTSDVCICDMTADWAVYQVVSMSPMSMDMGGMDSPYYKISYSIDDAGAVTLDGDPIEVEQAYVPVAGRSTSQPVAIRHRLELLHLELVKRRIA